MASVDVKWPSEDEEFDTTTKANEPATTQATAEPVTPTAETQAEPVATAATEETAPEKPADEAAPEAATPAAVTEPAPSAPAHVAPVATSSNNAGKQSRGLSVLRTLFELILLVALVLLALWGANLHSKNQNLQKQVNTLNANPAIQEQRKTNELVAKVGALMNLPTGEQPQAALVSDANALKQQYPFFSQVQDGDEILFYFKTGKVIVYRPSTNKIVQTGPLTVNTQGAAAASNTTGTKTTSR